MLQNAGYIAIWQLPQQRLQEDIHRIYAELFLRRHALLNTYRSFYPPLFIKRTACVISTR